MSNEILMPSETEQAQIRSILIESGALPPDKPAEPAEAADAAPAADPDTPFDSPEEAAEAAAMAKEAEPAEPEPAVVEPEAVAKPEEPAPKPEEDTSIAKGLASLARRENQLREREKIVASVQKENSDLKAKLAAIAQHALEDPSAFYKSIGAEDPSKIAAQLYYEHLGDAAPPEFKERKATMGLERKLQAMQKQLADQQRLAQEQAVQANAMNYLHRAVREIPAALPYLKAEASEDPAGTASMMYNRLVQLRDSGGLGEASTDEEIAAVVAQSLNADIERAVKRVAKLHKIQHNPAVTPPIPPKANPGVIAKQPDPEAAKPKSAPNSKSVTALTRPRKEPSTHEEDIADVLDKLKRGEI